MPADALLPLVTLIVGALVVWLLQGYEPEIAVTGATFVVMLSLLLAFCGAAALTNRREMLARTLITAVSFGVVAVVGVNFGLLAAWVAAIVAMLILAGIIAGDT